MRKKLLAIAMAATIGLSVVGCTSYEESVDISKSEKSFEGGYFTLIREWDGDHICYIVYANDTKVMYLIVVGYRRYGITPLYNADGSVQVYDGE